MHMVWSSLDELRHWLAAVPIDTTTWGQNGTKTVAALWQELLVGDTQLQTNPPQRQVQVVETSFGGATRYSLRRHRN